MITLKNAQLLLARNISTIKGELLPILVKKQFSSVKHKTDYLDCDNVKRSILHFVPALMTGQGIKYSWLNIDHGHIPL